MSGPWTAAEISEYDQAMRGTETALNRLVATLRRRTAEVGEIQAMADLAAYLVTMEPAAVRGTLLDALKFLADGEDSENLPRCQVCGAIKEVHAVWPEQGHAFIPPGPGEPEDSSEEDVKCR